MKDDCILTDQTLHNISGVVANKYKLKNTKVYQQNSKTKGTYPFKLSFKLKDSDKKYSISILVKMNSAYDIGNIFKEINAEIQPYII